MFQGTVTFIQQKIISVLPRPQKKLIICPKCLEKGKKEVLGEIDDQGHLKVLRFHQGLTTILANEFAVQCTCGEIVYKKINPDGTATW